MSIHLIKKTIVNIEPKKRSQVKKMIFSMAWETECFSGFLQMDILNDSHFNTTKIKKEEKVENLNTFVKLFDMKFIKITQIKI